MDCSKFGEIRKTLKTTKLKKETLKCACCHVGGFLTIPKVEPLGNWPICDILDDVLVFQFCDVAKVAIIREKIYPNLAMT